MQLYLDMKAEERRRHRTSCPAVLFRTGEGLGSAFLTQTKERDLQLYLDMKAEERRRHRTSCPAVLFRSG
jgi:hypothetical protein